MKTEKEILREVSIEILKTVEKLSISESKMIQDMVGIVQNTTKITELRTVFADMLEWSFGFDRKDFDELNQKLNRMNLPTLTKLRDKNYKIFLKILRNGKIINESEYKLVDTYLSNPDTINISEIEREKANEIMADYHDGN